jgi:23S rRNA (pseudouridine1915-N3)-methyltransferase
MRLIAVGRLKPGPEAELFARYNTRLRPRLVVTEVPEGQGAAAEVKRRESEALLAALSPDSFAVALDLGAPALGSEAFAQVLSGWVDGGRKLAFLIGGAEGFARPVLARAQATLSLGPLTWPHMLVRVMLAEQLYRAQSILAGHPYHRAGRPD